MNKRLTLVTVAAIVITAAMAVVSSTWSVARAHDSIARLGQVRYDEASVQALDEATGLLGSMDARLSVTGGLPEEDGQALLLAQAEYVRLAIKAASTAERRKTADGLTDDDVRALVQAARDKADAYLTNAQQQMFVPNITDLEELEASYAQDAPAAPAAQPEPAEQVQLC